MAILGVKERRFRMYDRGFYFEFVFIFLQSNGGSYGEPKRKRHDPPARPNHILLYTIVNPAYPITVVSFFLNFFNNPCITSFLTRHCLLFSTFDSRNISFFHSLLLSWPSFTEW